MSDKMAAAVFIVIMVFLFVVLLGTIGVGGKHIYDRYVSETAPTNLVELWDWPEKKLYRLHNSLQCSKLPNRIPNDLKQLKVTCRLVSRIWMKKRQDRLTIEVREGLKYLGKHNDLHNP